MKKDFNMIRVDFEKFTNALESAELTKAGISKEMGYGHGYINGQLSNGGKIRRAVANYLEKVYGIDPATYEIPETVAKPPEIIEPKECTVPVDYDKLHETIYNAVYSAVKAAWMDE